VVDLQGYQSQERDREAALPRLAGVGMLKVAAEERRDVGAGLGDDEVVDVEQLSDA